MSSCLAGSGPDATRTVYTHLLHRNAADAMVFLFSDRLSAALEPAVRHHHSPAASIEELRRLFAIKAFVTDTDGSKVEPTPLMDQLWKATILDTMLYADLQMALGCTLHRPTYRADNDTTARKEIRLKTLQSLYTSFFGSQPLTATTSIPLEVKTATTSPMVDTNLENKNSQENERILLCIRAYSREPIYFKVKPTTKVSKIYEKYSEITGNPLISFKLVFDGIRLDPAKDWSLSDYSIETDDSLEVIIEQIGC